MKKTSLSIILTSLIATAGFSADSISDAFKDGKVNGEIRAFYIDRDYAPGVHRNGFSLGGSLGFDTASYNGLSLGAKFYTTNGLGWNQSGSEKDPSLFGKGKDSYSILGEAYAAYSVGKTTVKVGRQKLATPLASHDDARMIPNLFEAAVLINSDVPNTTLILAHVTKMAANTIANAYGVGSAPAIELALAGGYGPGYESGKFKNMGSVALTDAVSTDGVTAIAGIYAKDGFKVQLWDYFAHDILNALYIDASYKTKIGDLSLSVAGQFINESDVGDNKASSVAQTALGHPEEKEVDSTYFGAKIGFGYGMFAGYAAFSTTDSNDEAVTNGGIISPWGGMPAYTQGMVTRHNFLADTDSFKLALSAKPIDGLKVAGYYAEYDVGEKNSYQNGTAWTASEFGYDFTYQATKELKLKLRGNFPSDFKEGLDWDEHRVIAYYKF